MKTEDTEVLGREINKARSKPNTVDRPVRTARIFVNHYNSTQYCKTETVFSILPFLQTNITSQMWPSGGKGGCSTWNDLERSLKVTGNVILCYITWTFYQRLEKYAILISDKTAEMTLNINQGQWQYEWSVVTEHLSLIFRDTKC